MLFPGAALVEFTAEGADLVTDSLRHLKVPWIGEQFRAPAKLRRLDENGEELGVVEVGGHEFVQEPLDAVRLIVCDPLKSCLQLVASLRV